MFSEWFSVPLARGVRGGVLHEGFTNETQVEVFKFCTTGVSNANGEFDPLRIYHLFA